MSIPQNFPYLIIKLTMKICIWLQNFDLTIFGGVISPFHLYYIKKSVHATHPLFHLRISETLHFYLSPFEDSHVWKRYCHFLLTIFHQNVCFSNSFNNLNGIYFKHACLLPKEDSHIIMRIWLDHFWRSYCPLLKILLYFKWDY
jgi:hypothetical protein